MKTGMDSAYKSLNAVYHDLVHERASERRRTALSMRRILGDGLLTQQGLPKSLMPWLGLEVFGVDEKAKSISMIKCAKLSETLDSEWGTPFAATVASFGENGHLQILMDMFMRRLTSAHTKAVATTPESGTRISFICLAVKKGDPYIACDWVPGEFASCAKAPLAPTEFGNAWLYYSMEFGLRWFPDVSPYPGIGSIVIGFKGQTCVLLWPMADTIEAKASLPEVFEMLNRFSSGKAKEYMKNGVWAQLEDYVVSIREMRAFRRSRLQSPQPRLQPGCSWIQPVGRRPLQHP